MQKYKEKQPTTEMVASSALRSKKHDDKFTHSLRELIPNNGNRQCFDCGQKGPTYVNMTVGSFVCTRCSGLLRGLTPPHRVKSISMATFTQDEINFLKSHGNDECAKTWLGLWDPKRTMHQDQRDLMIDKYERKRYYLEPGSPLKSLKSLNKSKPPESSSSTRNGKNGSVSNGNCNGNNGLLQISTNFAAHHKTEQQVDNLLALEDNFAASTTTTVMKNVKSSTLENNLNSNKNNNLNLNGNNGKDQHKRESGFIDFVADFDSANIFNSVSVSAPKLIHPINSTPTLIQTNGYAKIKPPAETRPAVPSDPAAATLTINGGGCVMAENFADFENAPIYNAADQLSNSLANNNNNNTTNEDRYAALKDLDEQLRESLASTTLNNDIFTNGNNPNPFTNPYAQNETAFNPFKTTTNNVGPTTTMPHAQAMFAPNFNKQTTNGFAFEQSNASNELSLFQQPNNLQQNGAQFPFNFNNGFGQQDFGGGNKFVNMPNNCGFGSNNLLQLPKSSTANGGFISNPFMAGNPLNGNNPFL